MTASKPRELTPLGERVAQACRERGISPTRAEREAGFGQGNLNRIMHGERGTSNVDVARMKALADLLGVQFEWLVIGTGPMRQPLGGTETLPAGEAEREALRAYLLGELEKLEPGAKRRLHQQSHSVVRRQPPRKEK